MYMVALLIITEILKIFLTLEGVAYQPNSQNTAGLC